MIGRYTSGVGNVAVFDVQLDQRFGMFGHKRQRYDDDGHAIGASPADFIFGRRANPFQRADPALIAIQPVELGYCQFIDHGFCGLLDLPLIRVAALDNFFWQAVGRKQYAHAGAFVYLLQRRPHRRGDGGNKSGFSGITAYRFGRLRQTNRPHGALPDPHKRPDRRGRKLRIERQQNDPIWCVGRNRARRRIGHRMPITHRHEDAVLVAVNACQRGIEGLCLRFGVFQ